MERKEAIERLKQLRLDYTEFWEEIKNETTEALDMAIASLKTDEAYQLEFENRDCVEEQLDSISTTKNDLGVDAISRQEAIDTIRQLYLDLASQKAVMDILKVLPSVTPQEPRKGHWIEHEWEEIREKGYYRCSVCNHGYQRYTKGIRKSDVPYIDGQEYKLWNCDNYCPNCGAKMIEPQESEET